MALVLDEIDSQMAKLRKEFNDWYFGPLSEIYADPVGDLSYSEYRKFGLERQ